MKNADAIERDPVLPGPPPSPLTVVPVKLTRDARVDVFRGLALLTIFIDHIPRNTPALFTLHNFGFSDAAEIFVLLAGYSSMIAYGGQFCMAGMWPTLARIARRCLRIYLFHAGLLLATLLIVRIWMDHPAIRRRPSAPGRASAGRCSWARAERASELPRHSAALYPSARPVSGHLSA